MALLFGCRVGCFLVWALFFLPFGCGMRGLFFTNMLDRLVVVGNREVRELRFHFYGSLFISLLLVVETDLVQ